MKKRRSNFGNDTEAASEVIGMVLLLAIMVTFFTLIQVSVVPDWNKKVEADHIPAVYNDMTSLSSDIADSASRVIAKSSSIQLGARYPDRMIFRNPGPGAFGTLTVEEDVDVSVVYNAVNTREFKTSRLIYELKGTVNSPKLVYEHGIIIRDWGDGNVLGPIPPENHTLFDECSANVYIPIVHGSSHSDSSLDSKSVSIFPFAESESVTEIAIINITMDTDYPDVWRKILKSTDNISARVSDDDKIEIGSRDIQEIYLPVVEDVISSDLYTGVITGTAILQGGLWNEGEGTDIMAIGSRVANIPSSADARAIFVEDIVVDEDTSPQAPKLDADVIVITVTDNNWNWWKAQIEMKEPKNIENIKLKSANGVSEWKVAYQGSPFTSSTSIDLFNPLNFDITKDLGGMYKDAGVGSNNRLVTVVSDDVQTSKTALISYRLRVDGV